MLLGIVSNPPRKGESESKAWAEIQELANEAVWENKDSRRTIILGEILRIARKMSLQVAKRVHVNGRGTKTSDHVQAIIYKHADDDELYIHGFGDADIEPITTKNGDLLVKGLLTETDVQMFAMPDGSVRICGSRGQRLWEDIDE